MDPGNDQEMYGGLWIDVPEGQAMLIFINTFRLPFTGDDFAKEAAVHSFPLFFPDLPASSRLNSLMYF